MGQPNILESPTHHPLYLEVRHGVKKDDAAAQTLKIVDILSLLTSLLAACILPVFLTFETRTPTVFLSCYYLLATRDIYGRELFLRLDTSLSLTV